MAGFDVEVEQMSVSGLQAVAVIDADIVSVAGFALCFFVEAVRGYNGSGLGRTDRLSTRSPIIQAGMQTHGF